MSYFTTDSELVYEYATGILQTWTSTVTYDFVLAYIAPPVVTSETSTNDDNGLRDRLPISSTIVYTALISLIVIRKFSFKTPRK